MFFECTTETYQLFSCSQVCSTSKLEVESVLKGFSDKKSLANTTSSIHCNKLRVLFVESIL